MYKFAKNYVVSQNRLANNKNPRKSLVVYQGNLGFQLLHTKC